MLSSKEYVSPLKKSQILDSAKKMGSRDIEEGSIDDGSIDVYPGNGYGVKVSKFNKELSPIKEKQEGSNRKKREAKDSNHLNVPGVNDSFQSNESRRRSRSHFTPSKTLEVAEDKKRHLMPKPSPRKMSKARDIS
jgi:hypothetical protein